MTVSNGALNHSGEGALFLGNLQSAISTGVGPFLTHTGALMSFQIQVIDIGLQDPAGAGARQMTLSTRLVEFASLTHVPVSHVADLDKGITVRNGRDRVSLLDMTALSGVAANTFTTIPDLVAGKALEASWNDATDATGAIEFRVRAPADIRDSVPAIWFNEAVPGTLFAGTVHTVEGFD
jgi:hypothetical protein